MPINQTNKEKFYALCEENKTIPLFMQAWWMDAVCENKKTWNVFLVEQNGKIQAAMPYHLIKKLGLKVIIQPQLTQYNGIWINYPPNQTYNQRIDFEKKIMTCIINELNQLRIIFFQQNFHYSITNWQPFYWNKFEQTTRYTYILRDIFKTNDIYDNFHIYKQKHIKKASRDLKVDFNMNANEFYEFQRESLVIKGKSINYSESFFVNLHSRVIERHQGKIIAIRDKDNNVYSATFFVWDRKSAYYLVSAIHPKYNSSGASSLMVWEAIQYLADKTQNFDFEGSMIEGVAKSFEEFGGIQTPYFTISKFNKAIQPFVFINKLYRNGR